MLGLKFQYRVQVHQRVGVILGLIDHGFEFCVLKDRLQVLDAEVADTDALELSLTLELLEDLPQPLELAGWNHEGVVHKEQVRNKTQLPHGFLNRSADLIQGGRLLIRQGWDYVVVMQHQMMIFRQKRRDIHLLVIYISFLGIEEAATTWPVASSVP